MRRAFRFGPCWQAGHLSVVEAVGFEPSERRPERFKGRWRICIEILVAGSYGDHAGRIQEGWHVAAVMFMEWDGEVLPIQALFTPACEPGMSEPT